MNITNSIITSYINNFYQNENEKLNQLRAFAEERRVPIILRDTEGLLLSLFRIKKPERILEIGTAIGYSACCFANGCGCEVVTVESNEESYDAARNNIEALGFSDKVEVIFGDAREILADMSSNIADCDRHTVKDKRFDVVFIDAAKSHYKQFWDLAVPLCREDALIICDNVLMKGMTASDEYDPKRKYKTSIRKMREFISYITHLEYADTCILPVGDGVSLSVIEKD